VVQRSRLNRTTSFKKKISNEFEKDITGVSIGDLKKFTTTLCCYNKIGQLATKKESSLSSKIN
jgi:hypothetical protein